MSLEVVDGKRILVVSNARGALTQINKLIDEFKADAVIHTGCFGFFDTDSVMSMNDAELRKAAAVLTTTSLVAKKAIGNQLRDSIGSKLSELGLFLSGMQQFKVPVYTSYDSTEDVRVVEKFVDGSYNIPNLHLVGGKLTGEIEGTDIKLFALPGRLIPSLMFDAGDGQYCAGVPGATWTGIWQIGDLLHKLHENIDLQNTNVFIYNHTVPESKPFIQLIEYMFPFNFSISAPKSWLAYPMIGNSLLENKSLKPTVQELATEVQTQFQPIWELAEPQLTTNKQFIESVANLFLNPPVSKLVNAIFGRRNLTVTLRPCSTDSGAVVLNASLYNQNVGIEVRTVGPKFWTPVFKHKAKPAKKQSSPPLETTQTRDAGENEQQNPQTEFVPYTNPKEAKKAAKLAAKAEAKAAAKAAKKLRIKEERKKMKEQRKLDQQAKLAKPQQTSSPTPEDSPRQALWFKNGERPAQQILEFLAPEDRDLSPEIEIRDTKKPDGSDTKVALVVFKTPEQAFKAYERVDKENAGTVTLTSAH